MILLITKIILRVEARFLCGSPHPKPSWKPHALAIDLKTSLYGYFLGLPWWLRRQRICLQCGKPGLDPWAKKIPWRREGQPTLLFMPGESHGQRSLAGYSPGGHTESDTTE